MILEDAELRNADLILQVTAATVLSSVLLRGLTAVPTAALYARRCASPRQPNAAENALAMTMPTSTRGGRAV